MQIKEERYYYYYNNSGECLSGGYLNAFRVYKDKLSQNRRNSGTLLPAFIESSSVACQNKENSFYNIFRTDGTPLPLSYAGS